MYVFSGRVRTGKSTGPREKAPAAGSDEALALYDSMLRFHLGDVQAGDLQPVCSSTYAFMLRDSLL